MNKFKQLVNKFKQRELELGDDVVWIHYYNEYPIALLAQFVEYSGFYKKSQIMIIEAMDETQRYEENNEQRYMACGVGYVGEEAVFPLIFADDPLVKPLFESETSKNQVASLSNPENLVYGLQDVGQKDKKMEGSELSPIQPAVTTEDLNKMRIEAARKLNEDLVTGQRVVLVENIEKENVVQGLIAQIVNVGTGNNVGKLKVCPVFSDFKRISSIPISISKTKCVPVYICSPGPLRQNYILTFTSDELAERSTK